MSAASYKDVETAKVGDTLRFPTCDGFVVARTNVGDDVIVTYWQRNSARQTERYYYAFTLNELRSMGAEVYVPPEVIWVSGLGTVVTDEMVTLAYDPDGYRRAGWRKFIEVTG